MKTLKLKNNRSFDCYDFNDILNISNATNEFFGFSVKRQDFFNGTKSLTIVSPKNPKLFYTISENDVLLTSNKKIFGVISDNLVNTFFDTGFYNFLGGNKQHEGKTSVVGIVAKSTDNIIGYSKEGKDFMPWGHSLKNDLQCFKASTSKNIVVMGRVTFDSLGRKPLPNRLNIVISSLLDQSKYSQYENLLIVDDLHSGIIDSLDIANKNNCDVFIMGGSSIYKQTMNFCTDYIITEIVREYQSDLEFNESIDYVAYFPYKELEQFKQVSQSKTFEESGICYSFVKYERK